MGCVFSVVAAMLMNKKGGYFRYEKEKDKLDINGNILFFDDFMSTGLNIEKACDIVNKMERNRRSYCMQRKCGDLH